MEPEGPASDDARGPLGTARRACDQCRLRKIRCDKRAPCANCRSSKIVCRSTGAGQKHSEPRRRVLISDQYERKIDQIEERLGGIENLLRDLRSTMATGTANASPSVEVTTPSVAGCPSNTGLDQCPPSPTFEGNSSLAAHSAYASKFLETAVSQSALEVSSPKIEAALSTLKEIVNIQDQQPTSRGTALRHQKAVPTTGLRDLKMPPAQVIVSLLRKLKNNPNPPSIFNSYFPFMSVDYFAEKCRDVYFATEDYSDATWIIVNGGLFYIFLEYSYMAKANETKSEHKNYLQICQNNLETGLANLNVLMSATDESIDALTLGAIYAIEISKPSLAWTLISTAAQQCQTLGYHRASSMENDSQEVQENKHRLFWSVYCLDKGLSLRLGRASTIQDYDITSTPTFNRVDISSFWKTVYYLWVSLARIQGKVYELLYSPVGLSQPESQRVAHARQLASEMQESVMVPFKNLNSEYKNLSELELLYIKCDDVSRLSILTLIYRAIPPPPGSRSTFIADCVETARSALEAHQKSMTMLKESNEGLKCSYMHWSILYAPFIPFIVIFCHILEVSDRMDPDLRRLSDFVASLQPLCPLSEAIDKLYRLCNVLSTIAGLYVEAKAQSANTHAAQDQALASMGQEFEGYLTALGLAPGLPSEAGGFGGEVPGAVFGEERMASPQGVGGSLQLGNWFSGNQHMMGLLEEDLEIFKGGYEFLM